MLKSRGGEIHVERLEKAEREVMWGDLDKTCGLFSVLVRHSVLSAESASVKTAAWSEFFFLVRRLCMEWGRYEFITGNLKQ